MPYNGEDVMVAVRVVDGRIQVQHPAAGWMDAEILEERLRRKLKFVDESGDQVTLRAKSTSHLHISGVVRDR